MSRRCGAGGDNAERQSKHYFITSISRSTVSFVCSSAAQAFPPASVLLKTIVPSAQP